MSEKRRAGPTGGRAEAKTTLARATAHMVKRDGYGDEHLTYGIIHTHAHCDSHRMCDWSCENERSYTPPGRIRKIYRKRINLNVQFDKNNRNSGCHPAEEVGL
jgi:hypothetical protein